MSQASSTNSSLLTERFGLDPNDTSSILVYKYREGLLTTSQHDLVQTLGKEPRFACSKIPIPRGYSRITVQQGDLYPEKERDKYAEYPSYKMSLACITLPRLVYWKRLVFNQYKDLYIVSPESSPESSPQNSAHNSPQSTFRYDHEQQATAGASVS
ncbi:hypothetical protein EJ06DRAFT_323113 [Trichodelitschia bisporula]|uniref:Uncharacterized protein n=1 Tax=Trichodelitschia bisporula TaxID=703511 RepID=A0A6G1I4J5_9PEZI|nr:hypothetical protein EJ06DRAFT_323113 [Trichodelitschia bisporula]